MMLATKSRAMLAICLILFHAAAATPAPLGCSWTQHFGKHLGGQDRQYSKYMSLEAAQKVCVDSLGVKCKGVTCEDEKGYSCAPRKGEPYLTDAQSPAEVSWVKHCTGLEKGQRVMSFFESHGGKSFYMEPAEVVKPKEFQVTLRFLSDGATQVVPAEWIDPDAQVRDPEASVLGGYSLIPEEHLAALGSVFEKHPTLSLFTVAVVLLQILTDLTRGKNCFGAKHLLPPLLVASYAVLMDATNAEDLLLAYLVSLLLCNAAGVILEQLADGSRKKSKEEEEDGQQKGDGSAETATEAKVPLAPKTKTSDAPNTGTWI